MRRGPRFAGFIVFAVVFAGLAVMLLWNALMPELFGLPVINFLQAVGLLLLSRILFGGVAGRRGRPRRRHWRARMREKWAGMSPEERQAFKEKMRHWARHGCWPEKEEKEEEEKKDDLV
jgi:hypothetical protein